MKPVSDGNIVVTLDQTRRAMRLMAEKARVIAEGAGALPLAAALTGRSRARARSWHRIRRQHRPGDLLRDPAGDRELT
jgi:threonine dehydratase